MLPSDILLHLHSIQPWTWDITADDVANTFHPTHRHYFHNRGYALNGVYTTVAHNPRPLLSQYLQQHPTFILHPNYFNAKDSDEETLSKWVTALCESLEHCPPTTTGWVVFQTPDSTLQASNAFLHDFRYAVQRLQRYTTQILAFKNVTFLTPTPTDEDPFSCTPSHHSFSPQILAFRVQGGAKWPPLTQCQSFDCFKGTSLSTILKVIGRKPPAPDLTLRVDLHTSLLPEKPTIRDFYKFINSFAPYPNSKASTASATSITSATATWPFQGGSKPLSASPGWERFDYKGPAPIVYNIYQTLKAQGHFGATLLAGFPDSFHTQSTSYYMAPRRETIEKEDGNFPASEVLQALTSDLPPTFHLQQLLLKNRHTILFDLTPTHPHSHLDPATLSHRLWQAGYLLYSTQTLSLIRFAHLFTEQPQSHSYRSNATKLLQEAKALPPKQVILMGPKTADFTILRMVAAVPGFYEDLCYVDRDDPFHIAHGALRITYTHTHSAILASKISLEGIHFHTCHSPHAFNSLVTKALGTVPEGTKELQLAIAELGQQYGSIQKLDDIEDHIKNTVTPSSNQEE